MIRTQSIIAPVPGPVLNMNHRYTWRERNARTANWRDAAFYWAKQHRLRPRNVVGQVEVWIEFGVKDPGKRRDPHNWYPTVKAILDGFTTAAVWPDDSSEFVRTREPVFTDDIKPDSIRITLTWEDPE